MYILIFVIPILTVREGQKATLASFLWPPGGNSFFFAISAFSDYNDLSSGKTDEKGWGRVSFLASWCCKSLEQMVTVTSPQPSSFCPSAGSDSISFDIIRSHWRSNGTQMKNTRRKHFTMANAILIPQICYKLLKPEHIYGKINYFLGIYAVLAITAQIPQ